MKVIPVADKENMSQYAADIIIERVRRQPSLTLGLATGSTPLGTYQKLIADHAQTGTSYREVTTVNLDEYVGISADNPNSYRHFMETQLFQYLDIAREQTHLPNGEAADMQAECRRYDALLQDLGGADLQLLGIGENGHIGFNEPGTSFASSTHIVELDPSTRAANARFFAHADDVPTKAITMGVASILQSREIVLLASGEAKAEAIEQLLHGDVSEQLPASALKNHPNTTLIADAAALSRFNEKKSS